MAMQTLLALVGYLPFLFRILWLPLLALIVFHVGRYFLAQRERYRLASLGIADIDALNDKVFEKYLEIRFRQTRHRVTHPRGIKDYGVDLVLEKTSVKTAVKVRRGKKVVGIDAVQEVVASKAKFGCSHALVATNGLFTTAAVELAACNRVELWDRDRLLTELLAVQLGPLTPSQATTPVLTRSTAFDRQFAASTLAQDPADALLLPTPTEVFCADCGKRLTHQAETYCRTNPTRFEGRLLCYEHQITAGAAMQRTVVNR